jgi:hypothetical protein
MLNKLTFRKKSSAGGKSSIRQQASLPLSAPQVSEPAPEVIKQIEEEFPEEDSADKREHFERLIDASPATVFEVFCNFVWRKNAMSLR